MGRTFKRFPALALWLASLGLLLMGQARDQGRRIPRAQELIIDALAAMEDVADYRGVLIKRELFEDGLRTEELAFKFARPFKVYVRYIDPNPGREALFLRGQNRDRIKAHKGSFPDVTANLDPRGRIAMQGNHHPITSFGVLRMLEVAIENIDHGVRLGDTEFEVTDGGILYGEPMWRLAVRADKGGRMVEAQRGENLWQFARRVDQDMYVILHHNDDVDSPQDLRAGQAVFVPNHYAWRGEYFFGKETHVLREAISWDQKGKLYEAYSFKELEFNPGLTDADFNPSNPEYGF